jgi:D-alanine--poly(phosphoribitol) ligase subunit 1
MYLLDRIDAWRERAPDRLAHVSPGGSLTYAELGSGADAVAAFVQSAVPDDASPIVVVGHKEPEMLLGFLGSIKAGHAYVPLDTSLPRQRVAGIVASAGAALVLTPETIKQAVSAAARASRPTRLEASDPYYVMFTSGSTGQPKGVTISLGCLTSFVDWMLAEHAFSPGREVFLNQAPFSFDLSVMDLYSSLASGGTLVSLTGDDIANPRRLYHTLAASGVTTWVSTPSFAELCLAERGFEASLLPELRRFLFCGETLAPALATRLLDRFPGAAVWNTYGPTETTVATTSVRIERDLIERYASLPVGFPKPDARVLVVDASGRQAGEGQRGEIVIAGPNVSPGYWRRPDLTERSFFTLQPDALQAYRTGDWGHLKDGMLFFEGRIDSQIKLNGYRIELGDVEANLRALDGVRDAVVVPLCRAGRIDCLAAFVIQHPESAAGGFEGSQRLRRALAERVPAYMVPRVVRTLDRFPLTPNGKVDRRVLEEGLG